MSRAALTEVTLGSASEASKRGDFILAWLRRGSEASVRGVGLWDPARASPFCFSSFHQPHYPLALGLGTATSGRKRTGAPAPPEPQSLPP